MVLLFWTIIFAVSLFLLVKGADWLVESAERIGLAIGLSPFIVGVTIVGVGTSFPELISSLAAVLKGVSEVVAGNVIGSNIANILLIVGISAVLGGRLVVTKSLIDLDLPLLAIGTVLILGVVWDGKVQLGEAILLLFTYIIYFLYTIIYQEGEEETQEITEIMPSRKDRREKKLFKKEKETEFKKPKISFKDLIILIVGIVSLTIGAKYLIDSVVKLSEILKIGAGVIAITAVAVGTSLPELLVSATAAFKKKSEVALGNIFGSNIFNGLGILGICGLFKILPLDEKTFQVGVPTMGLATLLFVISGISRRIHMWEGAFYLSVYILFVAKLFNWF